MDGATLYIKQLKPYLYLLDEEHQATGYLVIGKHYQQSDNVVCYDPENVLPEQPRSLRNTYDRGIV